MMTVEQVVASHKANLETLYGLTAKAFEGVEKIVELNLTASKAAMSDANAHAQSLLSVKDAQELLSRVCDLQAEVLFNGVELDSYRAGPSAPTTRPPSREAKSSWASRSGS